MGSSLPFAPPDAVTGASTGVVESLVLIPLRATRRRQDALALPVVPVRVGDSADQSGRLRVSQTILVGAHLQDVLVLAPGEVAATGPTVVGRGLRGPAPWTLPLGRVEAHTCFVSGGVAGVLEPARRSGRKR